MKRKVPSRKTDRDNDYTKRLRTGIAGFVPMPSGPLNRELVTAVSVLAYAAVQDPDEVTRALAAVREYATQDSGRAVEFARLVQMLTAQLGIAVERHPERFRELAEFSPCWPVLLGTHPDVRGPVLAKLASLGVGKKAMQPFRGTSPEDSVASDLFMQIMQCQAGWIHPYKGDGAAEWEAQVHGLHMWTEATAGEWWVVAKALFADIYPKDFENHPAFAHWWTGGQQSRAGTLSEREQKKERGLVRRGIMNAIKQAFMKIKLGS